MQGKSNSSRPDVHACTLREKQEANPVEGIHPFQGRHSGSVRDLKEVLEARASPQSGGLGRMFGS